MTRGLEDFIKELKNCVKLSARMLTTDPCETEENYEFAIPVNDLVLISGSNGTRVILKHKTITKYIIVSAEPIIDKQYNVVYMVQEDSERKGSPKLSMILTDAETLAVHCSNNKRPILPIGEKVHFIANPSNYTCTQYCQTESPDYFIRKEVTYDIASQLRASIDEKGIHVEISPTKSEPSQ